MSSRNNKDVKDIIKLSSADLKGLSVKEIKSMTTIMGSAVNKRVKRSTQAGVTTKAIQSLQKSGGNISVKGITSRSDAVKEFKRAQKFLTSKTGGIQAQQRATRKPKAFEQYLDLNPRTTSSDKLLEATKRLSSLANRRLKLLQKLDEQDITSPAYEGWKKAGLGEFGAPQSFDIHKLRAEYRRVSEFLKDPTSEAAYTRRLLHKINRAIERKTKVKLPDEVMKEFFSLYSKIRESNKFVGHEDYRQYKYELFRTIGEMMNDDVDYDEILEDMLKVVGKINEDIQNRRDTVPSDYFTVQTGEEDT